MKLKNTAELRLRALAHAREDHIRQGTYGSGSVNGHANFEGCAITCLATPHRKGELREFLRGIFGDRGSTASFRAFGRDEFHQMRDLRRDFGIHASLARMAEALFESQPTHGAAINIIPRFANALARRGDGRLSVTELRKAWRRTMATDCRPGFTPDDYQVSWPTMQNSDEYPSAYERESAYRSAAKARRVYQENLYRRQHAFLGWLAGDLTLDEAVEQANRNPARV